MAHTEVVLDRGRFESMPSVNFHVLRRGVSFLTHGVPNFGLGLRPLVVVGIPGVDGKRPDEGQQS